MNLIKAQRFEELTNQFQKIKPIIVLGDLGIDKYTYGEVKRISPEAPVPVLEVSKEWEKLGLAANISHNLQTLDVPSTLCGVVGEDDKAKRFEVLLEETNLKTWGVVRSPGRPTIFKERITTGTQQICRIDYEDVSDIHQETAKKLGDRVEDFLDDHGAVILEDYAKGTLTKELIQRVIKVCNNAKMLCCVDPGRSTPPSYYKGASLLKPNLLEAKMMVENLGFTYEKKNIEEIAAILIDKLDLDQLVITLGAEGMALLSREGDGKIHIIPTVAQEVFDVSGAGDTTISLLTAGLLAGGTLEEAAWLGNCGAGVVVAKKGTATVNLLELRKFYDRLSQNIQ